jgi:hypothetical protein
MACEPLTANDRFWQHENFKPHPSLLHHAFAARSFSTAGRMRKCTQDAHGPLRSSNGRGHCRRIGVCYLRVGGLRDGLKAKLSPKALDDLDRTFARLATADGDVFSAMDALGDALTNESQVIVCHLQTERIEQARQHIADAEDYPISEPP